MYRPPPLDSDLLQGDVFQAVPFIEETRVDHRPVKGPLEDIQQEVLARVSHRMVVLLSHSCDTTPRTPQGDPVVISPLKEISPHFHELITENGGPGRINSQDNPTFINWFYFEPTPVLGNMPWLVDFTRVQSIRIAKLRTATKLTELTADAREALKLKLHLHFCRPENATTAPPTASPIAGPVRTA
jgi:hypothetical protein